MDDRVELNNVVERGVLSYLIAQIYDKRPAQHALEQKLTFTPVPVRVWKSDDPAACSDILIIEVEEGEPLPQNGHYLVPDSTTG